MAEHICIIGDSHVGPLKAAQSHGAFSSDLYKVTWFVCDVSLTDTLALEGTKLVAHGLELRDALGAFSGGCTEIDLNVYDRFILIGHEFWMWQTANLYSSYKSDSLRGADDNVQLLSDPLFLALAGELTERAAAFRIARLIRSVSDKPVTVVSAPNPGFGLDESEVDEWLNPFYVIARNGDADAMAAVFRDVCCQLALRLKISIVPPLVEVALNGVFNKYEYCLLPKLAEKSASERAKIAVGAMMHASDHYGDILAKYLFN